LTRPDASRKRRTRSQRAWRAMKSRSRPHRAVPRARALVDLRLSATGCKERVGNNFPDRPRARRGAARRPFPRGSVGTRVFRIKKRSVSKSGSYFRPVPGRYWAAGRPQSSLKNFAATMPPGARDETGTSMSTTAKSGSVGVCRALFKSFPSRSHVSGSAALNNGPIADQSCSLSCTEGGLGSRSGWRPATPSVLRTPIVSSPSVS